jgi:hypothetical protein
LLGCENRIIGEPTRGKYVVWSSSAAAQKSSFFLLGGVKLEQRAKSQQALSRALPACTHFFSAIEIISDDSDATSFDATDAAAAHAWCGIWHAGTKSIEKSTQPATSQRFFSVSPH